VVRILREPLYNARRGVQPFLDDDRDAVLGRLGALKSRTDHVVKAMPLESNFRDTRCTLLHRQLPIHAPLELSVQLLSPAIWWLP
jgi:hypothetical protein